MTEEETVIFDILTRPAPDSSTDERSEAKQMVKLLFERLGRKDRRDLLPPGMLSEQIAFRGQIRLS